MNKRIKELALQAGGSHYPDVNSKQLETFAELIMLDCISQCRGVGNVIEAMYTGEEARRFKAVADSCEQMIKERFGVE